jgi:hypothetical protein
MDRLTTNRENVGSMFLPVIDEVESLVQDQMAQIFMAGMRAKMRGMNW